MLPAALTIVVVLAGFGLALVYVVLSQRADRRRIQRLEEALLEQKGGPRR